MKMIYSTISLSIIACFFSATARASDLHLGLDNPTDHYHIYRTHYGINKLAYSTALPGSADNVDQSRLTPFPGWHFSWQSATSGADSYLSLHASGDDNCASAFVVMADGRTVVINPDLPIVYNGEQTHPPLQCQAQIQAHSFAGETSQPLTISATIYPQPKNVHHNEQPRYVKVISSGIPASYTAHLPIFIQSLDYPLFTPARQAQHESEYVTDNFISTSGELVISGNTFGMTFDHQGQPVAPDSTKASQTCNYYPEFHFADPTSEPLDSLNFTTSTGNNREENPLVIYANWQSICRPVQLNEQATNNINPSVAASIRSKHRFAYGTFTAYLKASNHPGTNSTFFTYYANPNITLANGEKLNYGYTWHELDFELLPGTPSIAQEPIYSNYGYRRPVTPTHIARQSASLDVFSPGNPDKNEFGAKNHQRYCYNPKDMRSNQLANKTYPGQCRPSAAMNPFDGQFHKYTLTWDHDAIHFYFDDKLAYTQQLAELDTANGNVLFNGSAFTDAEGNVHLTFPMHIMANFWVPTGHDWAGEYMPLGNIGPDSPNKIYATYQYISWSPMVGDEFVGQEYSASGELLPTPPRTGYTWNFTQLSQEPNPENPNSFYHDWQVDPAAGFDYNATSFIQNNVLLDTEHGLRLCMTDKNVVMADYKNGLGIRSQGCDGNMALPPPYTVDHPEQALVILRNQFAADTSKDVLQTIIKERVVPVGAIPPNLITRFFNGWYSKTQACNPAIPTCGTNGWYADPHFTQMAPGEPSADNIESTILLRIDSDADSVLTFRDTVADNPLHIAGQACVVRDYSPATVTPVTGQNYVVDVTWQCTPLT